MQRTLVLVVMCLSFTTPLLAQDVLKHVTFGAGAGFSFPLGTLDNRTKTGFNFVASGGPRFNSRFSVPVDFSLHYLDVKSFKNSETNADPFLGSMVRIWSLTVNPSFEFIKQERFGSYVTGGYGLYNRKLLLAAPGLLPALTCDPVLNVCVDNLSSGPVISGDFSLYKGGYNVGGGVTFGARTKFFVEVRYHHMLTTHTPVEIVPLTFGIRW